MLGHLFVKEMIAFKRRARSLADTTFGSLSRQIECQPARYGTKVVVANRRRRELARTTAPLHNGLPYKAGALQGRLPLPTPIGFLRVLVPEQQALLPEWPTLRYADGAREKLDLRSLC